MWVMVPACLTYILFICWQMGKYIFYLAMTLYWNKAIRPAHMTTEWLKCSCTSTSSAVCGESHCTPDFHPGFRVVGTWFPVWEDAGVFVAAFQPRQKPFKVPFQCSMQYFGYSNLYIYVVGHYSTEIAQFWDLPAGWSAIAVVCHQTAVARTAVRFSSLIIGDFWFSFFPVYLRLWITPSASVLGSLDYESAAYLGKLYSRTVPSSTSVSHR